MAYAYMYVRAYTRRNIKRTCARCRPKNFFIPRRGIGGAKKHEFFWDGQKLCYAFTVGKASEPNPAEQIPQGGGKEMDDMPNAGEIIERLARENERQKIEIESLRNRIAELEKALAEKG